MHTPLQITACSSLFRHARPTSPPSNPRRLSTQPSTSAQHGRRHFSSSLSSATGVRCHPSSLGVLSNHPNPVLTLSAARTKTKDGEMDGYNERASSKLSLTLAPETQLTLRHPHTPQQPDQDTNRHPTTPLPQSQHSILYVRNGPSWMTIQPGTALHMRLSLST